MNRSMAVLGLVAASLAACQANQYAGSPSTVPRVVSAQASSGNQHSVLSQRILFRAEQADSARLLYWQEKLPLDSTPFVKVTGGTDTVVALGLRPSTSYRYQVEIKGLQGTSRSDTLSFKTDDLPELLRRLSISTTGTGARGSR